MSKAAASITIHPRAVVLGGGHAGAAAVAALRQGGYPGEIELISSEQGVPYQRPPLSKEWLYEELDAAAVEIRPAAFYEKSRIDLHLGTQVAALDRQARNVILAGGASRPYTHLVYALGASPVKLKVPGSALEGIHTLRSIQDA